MESPPLHSKRHLPTRHHLAILQHFKRRPRNLRHLGSLVPSHGLRQLRLVPLGRHAHRESQHPINPFHSRRTKHHARLQNHPRQFDTRLQQRRPLHEHHCHRPTAEHRLHIYILP